MRPSLRTLSALPTAGNSGVGTNYAHKSSKRLTRFRKDLRTIEENGTWDALKILVTFPEREISVALRTVCGSNVASGKCRENDMDSRLDAVAHILEGCLEEYTREEKEEKTGVAARGHGGELRRRRQVLTMSIIITVPYANWNCIQFRLCAARCGNEPNGGGLRL